MPPRASTSGQAAASGAVAGKKLTPVEQKMLKAGLNAKGGELSQQELFAACGLSVTQATQDAVNSLLRKNLLQMLRTPSGGILFRFLQKDEAKAMGSMDGDEKLVLDHIKEAGNLGIWTKTLTMKTGLPRATIAKALKVLEGRKAIKTVKSVKTPTRKIYMLAGIQPSVELTGGPWFTDNELDTELVDQLKKIALQYLQTRSTPPSLKIPDPSHPGTSTKFRPIFPASATPSLPTVQDVLDYIVGLEVAVVELLPEHVEALLDLMVYDGDCEKVFVRRDAADMFGDAGAGKSGKSAKGRKGKGKGKASGAGKGKRRKGATSSDEDSDDSSESDDARSSSRKKKAGRGRNGKPRKKRLKRSDSGSEMEGDDARSDDGEGSDDDAPRREKRAKGRKAGSEDEDSDDDAPRRKKRGASAKKKKKVKRSESDSDASDDSDASSSDSDDGLANGGGAADGADAHDDRSAQYVYRAVRQYAPVIGWTDMPCGRCPVEEFCAEPARQRAVAYRRPAQVAANPARTADLAKSVAPPLGDGAPRTRIELEGGIQGVGMLGGAGAAIGVSLAKWGEMKGAVGTGIAPVNPVDCPYFDAWLNF
ncbi:hypothetical protein JCM10207_005576 [Rhodosporidiobolus poonsookiae]